MYDEYDEDDYEEDINDGDTEVRQASPDEPVSLVLSGYTARRMDGIVKSHLGVLVHRAVEAKVDKVVRKAIEDKVAAVADEVVRERLANELDICLEEGWKKTDNYGKSCGGTVTLKDRIVEYLNNSHYGSSKQNGEKILREILDNKTKAAVAEFVVQLRKRLQDETDAMIKKRVNADTVIAEQLAESVKELFGVGK